MVEFYNFGFSVIFYNQSQKTFTFILQPVVVFQNSLIEVHFNLHIICQMIFFEDKLKFD